MASTSRSDATLRERRRMHSLNDAFDKLRKKIPRPSRSIEFQNGDLEKIRRLSKITTLRLAIRYIRALQKTIDEINKDGLYVGTTPSSSQFDSALGRASSDLQTPLHRGDKPHTRGNDISGIYNNAYVHQQFDFASETL